MVQSHLKCKALLECCSGKIKIEMCAYLFIYTVIFVQAPLVWSILNNSCIYIDIPRIWDLIDPGDF